MPYEDVDETEPIEDRVEYIAVRIIDHANELGIDYLQVPEPLWDSVCGEDQNPRRHIGYLTPIPHARPITFCPERIAKAAEEMPDLHLVWVMDTLLYVLDLEIQNLDKPVEEVLVLTNDTLADAAEGAMQLFNDLHMRALDIAYSA